MLAREQEQADDLEGQEGVRTEGERSVDWRVPSQRVPAPTSLR